MARLVINDSSGLAVAVDVSGGARIGREADCDVVVSDTKASRHHATIERDAAGDWRIEDAGSRHGTFINGARIESPTALGEGDRLQIGDTVFTFAAGELASKVIARRTADPGGRPKLDRLAIFYGLAEAARSIDDLDAVLGHTLESVVAAVGADRGLVALAAEPGGAPRRVAEHRGADIVLSRALIAGINERGEAMLVDERAAGATLEAQNVLSAMAAPIGDLGFIYLDCVAGGGALDENDLELLASIATFAAAIAGAARRFDRVTALAEAAAVPTPPILGSSPAILAVRRDIERLGASDIAVHISGESGVGKELVARALHASSARRGGALVAVNCAAMPDSLIESELFGHARGAFTGASQSRRGKFALADGGTMFLDEVADLSAAAQAKILRILEDGEVQPIGAERGQRVEVRVVSASHKDLRAEIAAGRFREDLYYRLVVAEIRVPPLRERVGDIEVLAEAFLATARTRGARASRLSAAALEALVAHRWPGNARELRNVIQRAAALAATDEIDVVDLRLDPPVAGAAPIGSLADQFAALDITERRLVEQALEITGTNVSEAARLLGISRVMIKRRMDRFGL